MITNKRWMMAAMVLVLGCGSQTQAQETAKPQTGKIGEHAAHSTGIKEFIMVAVEYQGTKLWLPGTMFVKKGDKVKVKLINNVPSEPNTHGFAIDAFKVKEIIARGEPKTIEFTADQAGLFTIYCQQHPAHVGGQLLVLDK